jgi:hypothetical protein
MKIQPRFFALLLITILFLTTFAQPAQQTAQSPLKGLQFRSIGPYRGGRSVAVAGVPSQPNVYYFGGTVAVSIRRRMAERIGSISLMDFSVQVRWARLLWLILIRM